MVLEEMMPQLKFLCFVLCATHQSDKRGDKTPTRFTNKNSGSRLRGASVCPDTSSDFYSLHVRPAMTGEGRGPIPRDTDQRLRHRNKTLLSGFIVNLFDWCLWCCNLKADLCVLRLSVTPQRGFPRSTVVLELFHLETRNPPSKSTSQSSFVR